MGNGLMRIFNGKPYWKEGSYPTEKKAAAVVTKLNKNKVKTRTVKGRNNYTVYYDPKTVNR